MHRTMGRCSQAWCYPHCAQKDWTMAKAFTGAALTKFKPHLSKRLEIPDGVLTGLYFIIQPTGRKSWAVRYRARGKPRKMVLGNYLAGTDTEKAGAELKKLRAEAAD